MKSAKQFAIVFFFFTCVIVTGCNNNSSNNKMLSDTTGTVSTSSKTEPKSSPSKADSSGGKSEITDVPVYAVWVSKKDNNMYDGLYDSVSRYLRLCETNKLLHIDDPSEVSINVGQECYSQGTTLKMIIIKKGLNGEPAFLRVVQVDPMNKRVVALTDNNDTIMTSVGSMNNTTFEKLKAQYQTVHFSKDETNKIERYYSPEMKIQNQKKKEMIIKKAIH